MLLLKNIQVTPMGCRLNTEVEGEFIDINGYVFIKIVNELQVIVIARVGINEFNQWGNISWRDVLVNGRSYSIFSDFLYALNPLSLFPYVAVEDKIEGLLVNDKILFEHIYSKKTWWQKIKKLFKCKEISTL